MPFVFPLNMAIFSRYQRCLSTPPPPPGLSTDIRAHRLQVAQLYISRPLLWRGRKFDLRIVALLVATNPLELYLHNCYWVRTAARAHKTGRASLEDPRVSLTAMHLLGESGGGGGGEETNGGQASCHPHHEVKGRESKGGWAVFQYLNGTLFSLCDLILYSREWLILADLGVTIQAGHCLRYPYSGGTDIYIYIYIPGFRRPSQWLLLGWVLRWTGL